MTPDAVDPRWDTLVGCLGDLVLTLDGAGALRSVDGPRAAAFAGAIGRADGLVELFDPGEREALRARLAQVLAGESSRFELRPLVAAEPHEARLAPIWRDGAVAGAVLVLRDLTAVRHAERRLADHAVLLERNGRELERFISVAAHDLQEPLRKVQAFGDRLRSKYEALLPEPGRDYVQRMQEAARRMQGLLGDLLTYSRLSARERTLAPTELGPLVARVLADLEVRIEELEASVEVGPLPTLEADPEHMRLLFAHLIGNAIKFRRPDLRPVVGVYTDPDAPAGRCRLRVVDNGLGVEARHHERIFGIFERLHGRGKYDGTGVGLAVCRKICEQHGGSIVVDSTPEKGSTFIVDLPLRQERNQHP